MATTISDHLQAESTVSLSAEQFDRLSSALEAIAAALKPIAELATLSVADHKAEHAAAAERTAKPPSAVERAAAHDEKVKQAIQERQSGKGKD